MSRPCWIILSIAIATPVFSAEAWKTVISNHCLECHDSDVQKGGLDLELILEKDVAPHSDQWETVLRQLQARQMPPVGKPRPDEDDYEVAGGELVALLDEAAKGNPNPGRTATIRRLTRTEYENAIRDLFDLEIDAAEFLPRDESSHGFDNVGVGDLSPALLERYISAAQKISRLAVGLPVSQPQGRTVRVRPDITQEEHVEGLPFGTRGGVLFLHNFPQSGEYEVRVRLARDRNEMVEGLRGKHEMEVLIDRRQKASFIVQPPENRSDHTKVDADLVTRLKVGAGPHHVGVTFVKQPSSVPESLRQPYGAHFNFHRHPRLSPAVYQVSVTGPFASGQVIDKTPSRNRIFTSKSEREILGNVMRLAYRRQVSDADIDRVMPFFDDADNFDRGIQSAVSAILVSRDFLFRVEQDPEGIAPGVPYELSDLELASRLSFFLWSSIPDSELLSVAERGELSNPRELEKQTRRLLADPRSESLVTNFADQWLFLRNLDSVTPDGRLFPDFDDNLRQAFRRETELLFSNVLREDRSVLSLLRTKETFLNERLAKHYGIPGVYGTHFRPVTLGGTSHRGGILRHASILTVTSYATRTSPVLRGNWILENLLGTPPPPPPDDVPSLDDNTVMATLSVRERLAAHRENVACASCHNVMDPVGFALENFDAVGRWRDFENGTPVDSSGGLADGSEFVGVSGLEAGLLKRPEIFVRTLTEKLMTYAVGRGMEMSDAAAIRNVVKTAEEGDYRMSDIMVGITKSPPFTMRMSDSTD